MSQPTDDEMNDLTRMKTTNEETTLESEYKKMKKELDIEHWEQKRIERPWEETTS